MAQMLIDALDVRVVSGIYLSLVTGYPGLATVRGTDTVVPALTGRIPRNRVRDVLGFVLDGDVLGTSASNFLANLQTLTTAIDPLNIVTVTLNDGYLGASGASIECRAVNWITSDLMEGVQWQHWNIEFEAVDPPSWS